MKIKQIMRFIVGISLFVLFLFTSSFIGFFTDLWWFQEVGYENVFLKIITSQIILFFGAGLFFSLFFLFNVLFAIRAKIPWIIFVPPSVAGQPVTLNQKIIFRVSLVVSIVLGIISGLVLSSYWQEILQVFYYSPMGKVDPIFGKDISSYFFVFPLLQKGISFLQVLVFITFLWCTLIYIGRGSFQIKHILFLAFKKKISSKASEEHVPFNRKAYFHVSILLFLLFVLSAGKLYLSLFLLLTKQNGVVFGANVTDITVGIPLMYVSLLILCFVALAVLLFGLTGKMKPLVVLVVLFLLANGVFSVIPLIFQKIIVAPNELVKETPYLKNMITATNEAFNVESVDERKIAAEKKLTAEDIANNKPTINNVRLWDRDPLLSTFSQIQEIRTYYDFVSVDNDRYLLDGSLRQIMLSPRELASNTIPSKNWINETLTFTHGYGITAGPVNQVSREGLPVLFVKDIPPFTTQKELTVDRPEIYYGELANEYVVVKTKAKEFNYPKGEENVYDTYAGTGGVAIDSFWKRLIYAIHFGSLKLFLSNDITTDSRIMYHRQLVDRVQRVAPFITFDQDPYMVVSDKKLYWMMDGYTMSNHYPYSQPVSFNGKEVNYLRNSVKVVVDAYNGNISFYLADENDPVIQSFAKMFPGLFKPLSAMPTELQAHIRYPEDLFTVQTAIYTVFHMDDPQIFYNREDQWEIPSIGNDADTNDQTKFAPRHMIMKLPGEEKEEFLLMLPFTPRAKDNLAAWMVARNDGENYGKLVVYQFPKQKVIYGPRQIIGRINQDPEISRQISLWDQRGSQVIQGPLLVIPIEESLIYVRPLYLKSDTGKIPELKRVIVAYENKIAMEETLEASLGKIFGTETAEVGNEQSEVSETVSPSNEKQKEQTATAKEANAVYQRALEAQRNGDWSTYGEEIKKLGEILQQLE